MTAMNFYIRIVSLFIGVTTIVSMTNALPLVNTYTYPPNQSVTGQTASRGLIGRAHGGRDITIHTRNPGSTDPEGSHVTAREMTTGEMSNTIIRRKEEDLSWPGFRRGGVTMSHEEEMACRERGGTPERSKNGRAECSMNPAPIRRTVWRKRKTHVVEAGWEAGDGHGR